jgi:hypothetical protein
MIVATVIFAVAVVGLVSAISGAVRNAGRLTDYDRAVQLAGQRMNELLLDDRLPRGTAIEGSFDPQQSGGLDAGWRAMVSNFEMAPQPAPGQTAIDRIELQIWWQSGPQRRTFTVDGYRPHVLKPQDIPPQGANP